MRSSSKIRKRDFFAAPRNTKPVLDKTTIAVIRSQIQRKIINLGLSIMLTMRANSSPLLGGRTKKAFYGIRVNNLFALCATVSRNRAKANKEKWTKKSPKQE